MWLWGRYYNQSLLRLRRRHLAAQPRTETRLLTPPNNKALRLGKRRTEGRTPPGGRELGRRGSSQDWKKGPSRHEGERVCEVQQEVGGRSEAGRRGRGQREGAFPTPGEKHLCTHLSKLPNLLFLCGSDLTRQRKASVYASQ